MEFREMRRNRQQLAKSECDAILSTATSGTLALLGDNGYTYAVPMSYVYADGKIYFHSARTGHKVDAIRQHDKVSFCVIAADDVHPSEFTTYFRSVIIFGTARILDDDDEKVGVLRKLGERYSPCDETNLSDEISKGLERLLIIEVSIDHMTGKEAIELVRLRK